MKLFDESFISEVPKCICCYSCIKQDSLDGCEKCSYFLAKYFAPQSTRKVTKSVAANLKEAIEELFSALGLDTLMVEGELSVSTASFTKDFLKNIDEVRCEKDIVELWHIEPAIAHNLFLLFNEVVFGDIATSEAIEDTTEDEADIDSDVYDDSTDNELE